MSGKIHLCRAYDLKDGARAPGAHLLVDRIWPRGIAKADLELDDWLKDIAPSDDLRKWFDHDPDKWEEFQKRYRDELDEASDAVEEALKWVRKGAITLIYGARDDEHNQAVVLRDYLGEKRDA